MPISLGSIVVDLVANFASYFDGIDKASYATKKATKEINSAVSEMGGRISESFRDVLAQFGPVGTAFGSLGSAVSELGEAVTGGGNAIAGCALAVGALGALALGAAVGVAELAKQGGEVVEQFEHLSEKTGISRDSLVAWKAVAEASGSSLDSFETGVRKLEKALGGSNAAAKEAQHVMASIGVTAKDPQEALSQIADAFKGMPDGAEKAAVAIALFGKSGTDMVPILNKGSQEIEKWQRIARQMGPDISDGAVKAAEDWKEKTVEVGLAWDKFKVQMSKDVLPVLTSVANLFERIAATRGGGPAYDLTPEQFDKIGEQAPQAKQIGDAGKVFADAMQERSEREIDNAQKAYDLAKARTPEAAALLEKEQEIAEALKTGNANALNRAASMEREIPLLKAAAELAEARRVEEERMAKVHADFFANLGKDIKPNIHKPQQPADSSGWMKALGFTPEAKNPLEGAPDLGMQSSLSQIPELGKSLNVGAEYIKQFNDKWRADSHGTADSINDDYNRQLADLQGMLTLGEVSEEDAKNVFLNIQQERFDGLKRLREQNGTSTFKDGWDNMFSAIQRSGQDFAASITQDIGSAIEGLNHQLSEFVATGKGLNLKQLGQGLVANITDSALKKSESSVLGLLGFDGKPDGSTQTNALWVQFANGGFGGVGGTGATNPLLNPLLGIAGGSGVPATGGSLLSSLNGVGGSIGSFFSNFGSLFGGFLANGGDAQPGKAYIVGEKRPELFMPRSAGTVVPTLKSSDGGSVQHITNTFNINTPDAESFRRSQAQISSQMGAAAQRGFSRNGR